MSSTLSVSPVSPPSSPPSGSPAWPTHVRPPRAGLDLPRRDAPPRLEPPQRGLPRSDDRPARQGPQVGERALRLPLARCSSGARLADGVARRSRERQRSSSSSPRRAAPARAGQAKGRTPSCRSSCRAPLRRVPSSSSSSWCISHPSTDATPADPTPQSRLGKRLEVTQDVAVKVMKAAEMDQLKEPLCPTPQVALYLPSLHTLRTVVERLKTVSPYITLGANNAGELRCVALRCVALRCVARELSSFGVCRLRKLTRRSWDQAPRRVGRRKGRDRVARAARPGRGCGGCVLPFILSLRAVPPSLPPLSFSSSLSSPPLPQPLLLRIAAHGRPPAHAQA